MSKRIGDMAYEDIITARFVWCETVQDIVKRTGISYRTVSSICQMVKYMKIGDMESLYGLIRDGRIAPAAVAWATKKIKIAVDESKVMEAHAAYLANKSRQNKERYERSKATEKNPPVQEEQVREETQKEPEPREQAPKDIPAWNERLYLSKIIEALVNQNELLTQLMDRVIPHWTADIKDCINANSDVMAGELKTCREALDAIRCNTRKRGL